MRHFCCNGQFFLFKQLHVLCSVLFLGNKIFASWEFFVILIFRVQLQLIFTVFLLNNLWNLRWGGKCFFITFRNISRMLVFTFLLCGGLNQMMFLSRCFLSLVVFIHLAWYLSLCLYPDLSKALWYGVTESLKISS